MEEDIMILGEYENINLISLLRTFKREGIENFIVVRREKLENLIKGYRELEEKIEKQELSFVKGYTEGGYNQLNVMKSKIKEKIEEYQLNMKKYEYADKNIFNENNIRQEVITILTELLMEDK